MILLLAGAGGGGPTWGTATAATDVERLPLVGYENGHTLWMAWADGPMLRFGNWEWWDGAALRTAPNRAEPGYPPFGWFSSLLDALVWKRVVVQAQDKTAGLDAELAGYFDSVSGATRGDADTWRHVFCVSLSKDLGATFARWYAVDTYREVPSLPLWPHIAKTANYEPTGTPSNAAWVYAQAERRHLGNVEPWDVEDGSGNRWTGPGRSVGGWVERVHERAFDNTEDGFDAVRGDTDYATLRPFNGHTAVLPWARSEGSVSYDVSLGLRHWRAYVRDGTAWVGRADNALPSFVDADTARDAEAVCVRVHRQGALQRVYLWVEDSGSVKEQYTDDDGASWSVSTVVATGKTPAACIGLNGMRWVYYISGAGPFQVDGKIYDAAGTLLESVSAVVSNVDEGSLAVDESPAQGGRHRIVLWASSSGSLTMYVSTDGGKTFS